MSGGAGRVTTVIATRNRWPDLVETLPRHQPPVVLVDNGSTDRTADLVSEHFPHVQVLALPENRGAVARNVGVRAARTPYVAFADDDSWWAEGALARAVELFDAFPRLGLVAGRLMVGDSGAEDPVVADMTAAPLGWEPDLPGPSVLGFLACAAVVRVSAFLEAGGFDDVVFFRGEEERVALDLRTQGWGLAYVDSVVAHHRPSPARDHGRAAVLGARNQVLTALMRRPWPVVAQLSHDVSRRGPAGRRGLAEALLRAPRALRRRRPVPPAVEAARRRAAGQMVERCDA